MNDEEELEIELNSRTPFTFLITFNFLTWFIYRIQDTEYEQFKADMHAWGDII